ncbi:MAG TPA: class I adenylate-forming enzyme family protein [Terriglobales bacterium]|nr:class I adenylate-forming enzyme family protein [Terriglobales bacterium]
MLRTKLYADPSSVFVHDLVTRAALRFGEDVAIVDGSSSPPRRLSFSEYADSVERLARGLVSAGIQPGDVVAAFLPNSWEFCVFYHAATMAGAIPTLVNPSYRERELRYQLEVSGSKLLVTDGPLIAGVNLDGLPSLKRVYTTRSHGAGSESFSDLLSSTSAALPERSDNKATLAALPFSSGTTGLPKGVMLTHYNLVANVFQLLGETALPLEHEDTTLCFLPLYHIYGLNVALNPSFVHGVKLVLMPRFEVAQAISMIRSEHVRFIPCVPPVLNAFLRAAESGEFPRDHGIRWVKSGAAPLPAELARQFSDRTGIPILQGYGMTEASPVTHIGVLDAALAKADSIGLPLAQTNCRILDVQSGVETSGPGELVMRGPQFMLGYWNSPESTADVLRDGWYWSGDIVTRDELGRYTVVDRRKEMIKFKGFSVAPAEVEAVLMEHPAVRDCGVVGRADEEAGEIPCAFVVLRDGFVESEQLRRDVCGFVGERLTHYKQPRDIRFVAVVPRNPSGKILRRRLREQL